MKSLKDVLRKTIAQKHLGKAMIGAIALNVIRQEFFDTVEERDTGNFTEESDENEALQGYVKFNKIFIKTQDQEVKIEIFKNKRILLEKVNQALEAVGYATKMVEIYLK